MHTQVVGKMTKSMARAMRSSQTVRYTTVSTKMAIEKARALRLHPVVKNTMETGHSDKNAVTVS